MARKAIIFCGPRGAGKSTLVEAVTRGFPSIGRLVTHTTRLPREGEMDGINYYFVSSEKLEHMHAKGHLFTRVYISPTQSSGLSKDELRRHDRCVTDLSPGVIRSLMAMTDVESFELLVLGVFASENIRKMRIHEREPGISESEVQRLIREDPVDESDARSVATFAIENDTQGSLHKVIDQVLLIVTEFLSRG